MKSYKNAKGWLSIAEREFLYQSAKEQEENQDIKHLHFVNIGVEYGASMHCLMQGAPRAKISGIDIDCSKAIGIPGSFLAEDSSCRLLKAHPNIIEGTCALLFVDGDHGYDGVLCDTGWTEDVRVGCLAIFHDCYNWPPDPPKVIHHKCPGVNQAVEEWYRSVPASEHKKIWESGIVPVSSRTNQAFWEELEPVDSMRIFRRIA